MFLFILVTVIVQLDLVISDIMMTVKEIPQELEISASVSLFKLWQYDKWNIFYYECKDETFTDPV
jgi:hypothetical protein